MKLNDCLRPFVVGLFLLGYFSVGVAAPFAPRPTIPADIADTYLAKSARDSLIPDAQRVGIPTYPGAVVIRTFAVGERPPKYEGLPLIELISADDYDTVVAFYKKVLPGWADAEMLSAYYFAQHGNINFFKPEEPHVGMHKLENYYREGDKKQLRKLLPGAQTLIKVFYARGK
ncbi:MAG: hypothetical protein GXP17_06275 [Gammaproteobacteria bacterium]|nr:hypothetical protein [Gammaproteobacteria bacterium]